MGRTLGTAKAEDLPAYTPQRGAGIIRIPHSTLRTWALGDGTHPPLFDPAATGPLGLSFNNLIEAFVLASIRRVHGVSMQKVRKAICLVAEDLGISRPLIHARFRTKGAALFVEHANRLLDVSSRGQGLLREFLDASLERIEWGEEAAARLYPWVRADISLAQPKSVVVDPRFGFGQPVITGTGVQTQVVAGRYQAGESVAELSKDYGLEVVQIEDAIRCESAREAA